MNQKENALRIIKFNNPEKIVCSVPRFGIAYQGANHQGLDDPREDGHDRPVGSKWHDIWNTEWHKEQEALWDFQKVILLQILKI